VSADRLKRPACSDDERERKWGGNLVEAAVWILVRTPVSALRAEELLRCFSGDPRLNVLYVFCPGSQFEVGTREWREKCGRRVISLDEASARIRSKHFPSLVVSTSENIDFSIFHPAPVVVLPHGLGMHKIVPDSNGDADRQSGVVPERYLAMGHVTVVVTHADMVEQLMRISPEANGRVVICGDTSADLIDISGSRKPGYRAALGVPESHRLLALSWTWGEGCMLNQWPRVLDDFLESLPSSRYRIALIIHPNMRAWRSEWEIEAILEPHLRRGGLIIVPAEHWHSLVVAADVFVGDIGSPTLYSAMAGVPTAFGTYQESLVAKDTVMEEANHLLRHIDRRRDLQRQIEDLIASHDTSLADILRNKLIAKPGEAHEGLKRLFYEKLGLDPPARAMPGYVADDPVAKGEPVRSHRDYPTVEGGTISLVRFPSEACGAGPSRHGEGHLVVDCEERNVYALNEAAVIADERIPIGEEVERRLARLHAEHPGSRLTAVGSDDGCEIMIRRFERPSERFSVKVLVKRMLPVGALASAVYSLLVRVREVVGDFVVRMGELAVDMSVTRIAP